MSQVDFFQTLFGWFVFLYIYFFLFFLKFQPLRVSGKNSTCLFLKVKNLCCQMLRAISFPLVFSLVAVNTGGKKSCQHSNFLVEAKTKQKNNKFGINWISALNSLRFTSQATNPKKKRGKRLRRQKTGYFLDSLWS